MDGPLAEVSSHSIRKKPEETTSDASAAAPDSDSAISARRDHQAERQPRPVATAATTNTRARATTVPGHQGEPLGREPDEEVAG